MDRDHKGPRPCIFFFEEMIKIDKYKWDLSKIIKDHDHFQDQVDSAKKLIGKLQDLEKSFEENLGQYLVTYEEAAMIVSKIIAYTKMKHDEDTRLDYGQKIFVIASDLVSDFNVATASLRPKILAFSKEDLDRLIKDQDLEKYRKFIGRIYRFKDYTLKDGEEKILGALGFLQDNPARSFSLLIDADLEFDQMTSSDIELNNANYGILLEDPNPQVREEAFVKFHKAYKSVSNLISSLYSANVKALTTEASLRGYESARHMELYEDDVDVQVYDNLIQVIRDNLGQIHHYYQIKKDYLGLNDQHIYDTYLPITQPKNKKIPYDQAKDLVLASLEPMGKDYVQVAQSAFQDNWIDVYPRPGKTGGAYSYGTYKSDPNILLNYTDDYKSLFTLAHELGHSMHSYYSRRENPYIYSDYTIFVAEVASTTNELLLLDYLMKETEDPEEKLYLTSHYIESFKSTVFRQTMFAEFEKSTHQAQEEGQALTLKDYNDLHYQLNVDYFGPSVIIDQDIEIEWARIPHFYRNFYVYKYATGFCTAVKLSQDLVSGDKDQVQAYLNFLKDGGQNFPLDQLRACGVDLSTSKPLEEAMEVLKNLISQLESLIS